MRDLKSVEQFFPENLANFINNHKQFVIYIAIGLFGLMIELGVFAVLFNILLVDAVKAHIVSSIIAILNNFILNAKINFRKTDKFLLRMLSFFGVAGVGLLISSTIVYYLTTNLSINGNIAKIIAVGIIVAFQYTINKKITFK